MTPNHCDTDTMSASPRRLVFTVELQSSFVSALHRLFKELKIADIAVKADATAIIFSGQSANSPPIIAGAKGTVTVPPPGPTRNYTFATRALEQVIDAQKRDKRITTYPISLYEENNAFVMQYALSDEQPIEIVVT